MAREKLWAVICLRLVSCTFLSRSKSPEMETVLETALIHRDHYLSPFHNSNRSLKLEDRLAESVRRSIARIHHLERKRHMITVKSPISYTRQGSYLMNITLGTPPRSFLLVADTGSDVTWVPCKPCFDCFEEADTVFDPTESSTYRNLSCSDPPCIELRRQGLGSCGSRGECQYLLGYADGSQSHGIFSKESLTVETTDRGSMVSEAYLFGCRSSNGGRFRGIDGIVGLGRGSLSFPSQISHFISRKFSYCLVDFWRASNVRNHLIFGSQAAEMSSGMQFTALVPNEVRSSRGSGNYYVNMEGISVDGRPLRISPTDLQIKADGHGGTFFDSGATVSHFVTPVYTTLLRTLRYAVHYPTVDGSHLGLELCFNVSGVTSPKFPAISFRFRGADLNFPSENTFIAPDHTFKWKGTTCLAMLPSRDVNVIGSIQMQNFRFLYDVENTRIGFKHEDCGQSS